ncbi:MAG TPA: hypothetical protein VJC03_06245, partial [bacterium]|nr:hypothetical protein [bacterium]
MVLLMLLFLWTGSLAADIPRFINFQGKLTDDSGIPLTGEYDMLFSLYDGAGSQKWTETHQDVVVFNGLYTVRLGTSSPLSIPFDEPYFLEILVEGELLTQEKIPLLSSPYSFRTSTASFSLNTAALGGHDPAYFLSASSASAAYVPLKGAVLEGSLDLGDYTLYLSSAINGVKRITWSDGSVQTSAPVSTSTFLGKSEKAYDSDLLDGRNYDAFVSTRGDSISGNLRMGWNDLLEINNLQFNYLIPQQDSDFGNKGIFNVSTLTLTGYLDMKGNEAVNLAEPGSLQSAATKNYVDSLIGGGSPAAVLKATQTFTGYNVF